MESARYNAVKLLSRTFGKGGYSNIILDSALSGSYMEQREKNLCASLYYGVLERKITLDYIISGYANQKLDKLRPDILNILRLGIYQMKYMDGIPDSAAVNESVKLVKQLKMNNLSGFVNAVLRNFQRDNKEIKVPASEYTAMSVKYSSPEWLVRKLTEEYGEEMAQSLLKSSVEKPPVTIRLNTLRDSVENILRYIDDLEPEKIIYAQDAYILHKPGNITESKAFADGLFHVQDIASQLCCEALEPEAGQTVLDLCSAPGGKAFTIAEIMRGTGKILAFDIHDNRIKLIKNGADRLGLTNIEACKGNAKEHNDNMPMADRILCDVPCSGLGVIRRKPEIKYKDYNEFESLPQIQYNILTNAASYLKTGGYLVYSTCTVSRAENDMIVDKFLKNHDNFEGVNFLNNLGDPFGEYKATLVPEYFGSDGFFISKFRRVR